MSAATVVQELIYSIIWKQITTAVEHAKKRDKVVQELIYSIIWKQITTKHSMKFLWLKLYKS